MEFLPTRESIWQSLEEQARRWSLMVMEGAQMIRMRIGRVRTVMTLLVSFQVGAIALLGAVIKASGKITCPHIVLVLSLCEIPLGKDLKIQRLIRKGGGLKWLIERLWWWRLDRPIKPKSIVLHLNNRKYTSRLSQELSRLYPHPRLNNAKVLINLENLLEKKSFWISWLCRAS